MLRPTTHVFGREEELLNSARRSALTQVKQPLSQSFSHIGAAEQPGQRRRNAHGKVASSRDIFLPAAREGRPLAPSFAQRGALQEYRTLTQSHQTQEAAASVCGSTAKMSGKDIVVMTQEAVLVGDGSGKHGHGSAESVGRSSPPNLKTEIEHAVKALHLDNRRPLQKQRHESSTGVAGQPTEAAAAERSLQGVPPRRTITQIDARQPNLDNAGHDTEGRASSGQSSYALVVTEDKTIALLRSADVSLVDKRKELALRPETAPAVPTNIVVGHRRTHFAKKRQLPAKSSTAGKLGRKAQQNLAKIQLFRNIARQANFQSAFSGAH